MYIYIIEVASTTSIINIDQNRKVNMGNEKVQSNYDQTREKQSMKKQGTLNPMYGKRHDIETKEKISQSQKQRWDTIRKAIQSEYRLDPTVNTIMKKREIELLKEQIIAEIRAKMGY